MPRRLFTLLAAFSLFLCAAATTLWIRQLWAPAWYTSYTASNTLDHMLRTSRFTIASVGNSLYVEFWQTEWPEQDLIHLDRWFTFPASRFLGFGLQIENDWSNPQVRSIVIVCTIPMWFLILATSALPIAWLYFRRYRPTRRLRLGLCSHCGYDLRATKDQCPECGSPSPNNK